MKITLNQATSISVIKAHREHLKASATLVKEVSLNAYRVQFNTLVNKYELDEDMDIKQLTTSYINQLVVNMQHSGLASATINNHLSYLRNLLNYCLDVGYIDSMPKIRQVKSTTQQKQPLTNEQVEKLLRMPSNMDFPTYRNWIQCQLMLATGIRSRNVRELKVKDFDAHTHTLFLSSTKNGDSYTIHLSSSIVKSLINYLNRLQFDPESYMFPTQYGNLQERGSFYNSMDKFFKMQGVETTCHILRHTYASQLAKSNVPIPIISKMLCHKNLRTTSRYILMMDEDVREVAQTIDILAEMTPKAKKRIKL